MQLKETEEARQPATVRESIEQRIKNHVDAAAELQKLLMTLPPEVLNLPNRTAWKLLG